MNIYCIWGLSVLLVLLVGCDDRYRYPCQDPDNWEKEICKMPKCDVTRTCPEHIFKGQRDPRLGPPTIKVEPISISQVPAPAQCTVPNQGVSCGK